jgi:lipopolysaccharide transport protein LptA
MKTSPIRQRALFPVGALALTFLEALPGNALPAAKAQEERPAGISFVANSMDTDFKTNVVHLKDVTITYGTMTVKADRALATAVDFKNSRWTFDGNVRINAEPRGNLRSDEAVVEFRDNQLRRATATGAPAEFDQKRADSDLVARGHAAQIVYEVGEGTVQLSNDAWITDGRNDISGPLIVYSLREEHVQAFSSHDDRVQANVSSPSGTGDTRVHVTIAPSEAPKLDGAGTNKPKPADPQPQTQPQSTGSTATAAAPSPATPR